MEGETTVVRVAVPRPFAPRPVRRRVLLGVSWAEPDGTRAAAGVRIEHTFESAPSAWRLFGGDVIVTVNGMPVQTAEDVVFYWDGAPVGEHVAFEVRRVATHTVRLRKAELRADSALSWRGAGSAPVVEACRLATGVPALGDAAPDGAAPEALLPSDLVVCVDGAPVAERGEVAGLIAHAPGEYAVLAVRRGAPVPLETGATVELCCGPCWRTKVPKVRRRAADARPGDGASGGRALAEFAPRLLEG